MLRNKVNRGYALRIALGMLAFMLLSGSAAVQGKTWYVLAGGETPDMAIQGMGFYPGNITINEGDTINWTLGGHNLHTVSFLSGGPTPIPGSPASLSPAGGSTYDGTGIVSSGLIFPGMSYSLTFTTAGNYSYQCLIHSGMAGAVMVQNAGSPYPFTQGQYNAKGRKELKEDLETGKMLVENLGLTSNPGPNGTTVWQASIDIPLPVDAKHKASYMRFTPRVLKIHTDDQVVWTQLDPMEIHTVTFLAAGQKPLEFVIPIAGGFMINPDAAAPSGGSSYNGTGNASSGVLPPGQNYTLKFTKPGTYSYLCLIHDEMKMVGKVLVMPPGGSIEGFTINDTNGNGKQDAGEAGLPGWKIKLKGIGAGTRDIEKENTTDAMGFYRFDELPAGKYLVEEVHKKGFVPTSPPVKSVTLAQGENSMNNNFTNKPKHTEKYDEEDADQSR
ncbi:MAG: plastocyanin/azurin family copper-binding protein [Candidatus Methanoperedens sp.]|nr:plastocyanin/azurin family copper-binding protein [Candidatus Methanoperedens sp.]MCZ7369015.1 plastocyanin/azurin family copper-binding protein [Candidatus Methanoperedens sp.]